jgi:hypothetical protein
MAEMPIGHLNSEGTFVGPVYAFADIAELFTAPKPGYREGRLAIRIYEIKPKIHTVFGIVRQCRGLEAAVRSGFPSAECQVWAVVKSDDPQLAMLRRVQPCLTWNTPDMELEGDRVP